MMKDEAVKPVVRALRIVEAMNLRSISSVDQLHRQTGLPKSTLVRLLGTLISAGYVQRLDGRGGYCLKSRVLALSRGFEFRDQIVVTAIPHLRSFTRKHKWPVTIAIFDTDAMVPKYTTMKHSPLSNEPDMKSSRTPVTTSAVGQAWLAFRPKDERDHVINTLVGLQRKFEFPAEGRTRLNKMLSRARQSGYAKTPIEMGKAVGLAVPVLKDGLAIAAITMRYYRSAMPFDRAIERYLPDLQGLASAVADDQEE
jgi:IclR family mhp operon transcriptional activator